MSDRCNVWTEADVRRLRQLWDEGHSARLIGEELGFSKNSVISKAHRLHLPSRPSPLNSAPRTRRTPEQVKARAAPPPPVLVALPPPPPPPEPVVRLCQYPHGNPGERGFRFCEAAVQRLDSPYCRTHHALCWTGRARAA